MISRYILLIALLGVPAFAAEPATAPVAPTPAAAVPKVEINYKDAFLQFALEKAQKYSGAVEGAVSKAVDAATDEAPIVAHEYLHWKLWYHAMNAFAPMIALLACVGTFVWQWTKFDTNAYGHLTRGSPLNIVATILGGMGTVVFALMTCVWAIPNLMSFIQILVAPRVYVIEQVLHLVGK